MSNSLEERLRANSSAFDGLLSLIPAKYYYDEETKNQWKAKKKTKEQYHADKMNKLDPEDNAESNALHVLKLRERVAKPVVLPGERLKKLKNAFEDKIEEKEQEAEQEQVEEEDIRVIFDDEGNEIPVQEEEEEQKEEEEKQPKKDKIEKKKNLTELRSKLQAKIQTLRAKRKAPGSNVQGAPLSRDAILKERKRKEELKKQKKQQDEDEDEESDSSDDDDASDVDDEIRSNKKSAKDEVNADNVMFQNIVFDDGAKLTSNLRNIRKNPNQKKKGPSKNDIKAHLKLLETKQKKIESKDELEQIKLKEKDKWQRAMLQAEGVKLKDDEKLLRKALKRKESKKRKSAVEWSERQRTVQQSKMEKAKRREENLKIRKENKGVKRSKQQKMKRKFTGLIKNNKKSNKVSKKRAGFEGRLKSSKK
ncbi:hypothetical protein KAFR_0C03990 [Kazachstania africana CBS 2517]|uniref:Ribosomal RNA-processing protein 14/surfeit locus protein 6 C-terminal domain-containing protein n=1 Tax=Kazachstania africana (strain ATCC 22294 / BCRC 22015 / CBS 2517 / CECT 1963 / NBRC 1671 / NRRL Y-8276) TaxID=1071382 RepID=H2ASP0_KAZAF|nr:hypothetical protein KAFR_0C03990 [Kazachstania africana CBS 2517]CCF57390.1 hypothetical protein KAFR_0C03990 [Kazachstania africana CBS 2517]